MNFYLILRTVLIVLIVPGLLAAIMKGGKAKEEYNDGNIIKVILPKILFVLGLVASVFCAIMLIFSLIAEEVVILDAIGFSVFLLLSLFMVRSAKQWKIEFRKHDDYFKYKTIFGKAYDIKCSEVEHLKVFPNTLIFKCNGKRFVVSAMACEYEEFSKYIKNSVPDKSIT